MADRLSDQSVLLISQSPAGVVRHILDLSAGLEARGWRVTIAHPRPDWFAPPFGPPGVDVIELPMVRDIHPLTDMRSFVRLFRLCRRVRPTVVHLHSSKAGFLGRIGGRLARVPVIIYTPHCWSFQPVQGKKRRIYAFLEKLASRFCDMTVAVSQQEVDEALELGVLDRSRITLIHNGVTFRKDGALPQNVRDIASEAKKLIVTAGRLGEPKGYPYLFEAMTHILASEPDAKLIVAGDGPLAADLDDRVQAMGLAHAVHLVGELEAIEPLLKQARLFVLSSLWEGLPYVVMEAMAAGLAVVATNVGGCPELVMDGQTGLLVPPKEPRALADAVLSLLNDPNRCAEMGAAGRDRARDEFRLEKCIDATEALYMRLIERKRAGTVHRNPTGSRAARILAIAVVAGILAVSVADQTIFANRIFPGVRIGPVNVGWMTSDAASRELSRRLKTTATVTLRWQDGQRTVRVSGVDLGVDSDEAAGEAYIVGRTGSLPTRLAERSRAWMTGFPLHLRPRPGDKVRSVLAVAADAVSRRPVDARFALRVGKLKVIPSKPGVTIDRRRTLARLAGAVLSGRKIVTVSVVPVAPEITTAQASALAPQAARWIARPIRLTAGNRSLVLKSAQILPLITIRNAKLEIGARSLAKRLSPIARGVRRTPTNARFNIVSNRVLITGGRVGRSVNVAATTRRLAAALASRRRYVSVSTQQVLPPVTRGDLAALGIKKVLSSFTTRFRLGADGRDVNINLSARAVRGKVLAPGQIFSLNRATGPRTARTGYKEALVFSNGKVVPGIGGGVCQVSSTLYEAALFANLRIVERSNHSMAVTYLPPGRDATAFYPTVDLKFENSTGRPILLWSTVKANRLTMQVFGSGRRPRVEIRTRVRKLGAPKTDIVYDPTLPPGARVVQAEGRPGYVAVAYRVIWQGKRVVRREYLSTDRYKPRNRIIRVGP